MVAVAAGIRGDVYRTARSAERVNTVRLVPKARIKVHVHALRGKLCRKLLKYAKKEKIASGAIFRTRSGREISRRQVWTEMKALCGAANVEPSKVFPHNLRHLFATAFYRACKDIARLADILGHSSIETTRIYLAVPGSECMRQLDRLGLIL